MLRRNNRLVKRMQKDCKLRIFLYIVISQHASQQDISKDT